jgi:outer membrane autotransporter protein
MKTSNGLLEGKWHLRTMAGAGMLFMPLASQASDLLWTKPTYISTRRADTFSSSNTTPSLRDIPPPAVPNPPDSRNVQGLPSTRLALQGNAASTASKRASAQAQLAAHVAAPAAMLAYGNQINDGLHQRLGEIRNIMPTNDIGGEVFVRYSGSDFNVAPGAGLAQAGYGFKQRANAVQLGGSVIGWNQEGSNLRAGWAYDQGSLRVTPKRSGEGYTDYDAKGMSLWFTAQRDTGLYVDVVGGSRQFTGRIQNDGGNGSARVRARGWAASVETGLPMPLTDSLTLEPQAQFTYQSLRIKPVENAEGLVTRSGNLQQTTTRIGVRLAKTDNERFVPYVKVDFNQHFGGQSKVTSFDPDSGRNATLDGVRAGASIGLSAGMTIKLTRVIDFYGDMGVQRHLGERGANGITANAGLRINF